MPFRTQVKFFLENAESLDLAPFAGVFQQWIQRQALEGLPIDVADYRHVYEGPGVVLIGHESDYSVERRGGRLGLLHTRKRQGEGDLQTQLRTALRLALAACELLEAEKVFTPRLKFRADEIEIRFADRLQFPNRPETLALVQEGLGAVLAELYGDEAARFAPVSQDERALFTVEVHAEGAARASIGELRRRLQPSLEK